MAQVKELNFDDATNYKYIELDKINEDLHCLICKQVLTNPQMLFPCGDVFCQKCIQTTEVSKECPTCKESYRSVKPVPRILYNMLANLKVQCLSCSKEETKGNFPQHYWNECVIECPHGCGSQLFRSTLVPHEEEECPKKPTKCLAYDVGCGIICSTPEIFKEHIAGCPYVELRPLLEQLQSKIGVLKQFVVGYKMRKGLVTLDMSNLSEDINNHILSFLDKKPLHKMKRVSRMWKRLATQKIDSTY